MFRCCATRRQPPATSFAGGSSSGSAARAQVAKPDELFPAFSAVLTDGFWESYKTKKPTHHPGALAEVPQILDLDSLMFAMIHGAEHGSTAALKCGERCLRESVHMAYLDQATLSLTEAEKYFPEVLELCQGLAPHFGYVTARVVLDPPNVPIPPLQPEGDIFVLALWGEQSLTIARSVVGLPMTAPRPGPMLQSTLRPGDILFIPGGVECRTAPPKKSDNGAIEAEPVLYIVLTVRTNEHSLGTSLSRYLNDLLRDENMSEEANSFFRSIPTKRNFQDHYPEACAAPGSGGSASSAEPREKVEARLKSCVTELTSKLKACDLRKHYEQRMQKLRQEQVDGARKTMNSFQTVPRPVNLVTSSSWVRVARGITCQCAAGTTTAMFKRGAETLQLPIYRSASYTISELCDGRPHAVESLSCCDPVERVCVLQVLVFKDCVELCASTEDGREDAKAYAGSFSK